MLAKVDKVRISSNPNLISSFVHYLVEQMDQFQLNTATGYMAFLDMRLRVPGTGHVGMEQRPNNYAVEDCSITRTHIAVIGLKMLKVAKNTVSSRWQN